MRALGEERLIGLTSLDIVWQFLEKFVAELTDLYFVGKTAFRLLFHNNDFGNKD